MDKISDIIQRMKALGIGQKREGPRIPLKERGGFALCQELRIRKLGREYGPQQFEATQYAMWLRAHRKFRCAYCRGYAEFRNRKIDHFIPLSRGGEHVADNLVPACHHCNCRKAASDTWKRPVVFKSLSVAQWKIETGRQEPPFDFEAWCRENS